MSWTAANDIKVWRKTFPAKNCFSFSSMSARHEAAGHH